MTPKKKAKEIYFAMLNAGAGITSDYLAGECAKIMINEIVNEIVCIQSIYRIDRSYVKYWNDVRKELRKLTHSK